MAPERPRSVGYDLPLGPRIIERKPESEFRRLFRPAHIETIQPRSILRRPEPGYVEPEYVELREPRRPRSPPIRPQRSPQDDFVPLPPPVPSPRHLPDEEAPILEIRSPRRRPVIHAPPSPLREHRRRRSPSPPTSPIREVETIRIRRLDNTDRGKAERQRARNVEEEARVERERRHEAEDATRHLSEIAMRERAERRRAERDARNADAQRRSAEVAAADLQRENERLDRERRVAEREAAVLELERERERERLRDALGRSQTVLRPARDLPRQTRDSPQPLTDRGAEVIQAARNARHLRRGERITYYVDGRRMEQDRHD